MLKLPALVVAIWFSGLGAAWAADDVSVQLDYVVRGDHAMFFVAKEKGYFARTGINVTAIRKGTGTPDALRLVGNGNAEFGFGDLPTLAVARSQGVPVVALIAVNERSPLAIMALKKSKDLKAPSDLRGLNIGIHPAGSTYVFFRSFLKANGMQEADMKMSTVSPPYENYLLLGRVDVIAGYLDAEVPELEAKAGGPGSLSILQGADYGWEVYGSGVFTSEKMVQEKPDVVRRFVAAYVKAFHEVLLSPPAAAALTVKANPEYAGKEHVLEEQLAADVKSTFTSEESKSRGLGSMSRARWVKTIQILKDNDVLKADVTADSVYAEQFVEAAR